MQRIMIVGQPGSGKSWLAQRLGRLTGLPVVHIDHIHWMPGWVERPHEEKTRLCQAVEEGDAWIFEGGHSATWANRLARADLLIWLDLPVGLPLWRVLRRTLRGSTRPDMPKGCPGGLHRQTLPYWRFIWRTRHSARAGILRLASGTSKPVVRLGSKIEVAKFLADWPALPDRGLQ